MLDMILRDAAKRKAKEHLRELKKKQQENK